MNPLCSSSLKIEDTSHYLLHCHHCSHHRIDLMNSVNSVFDNFGSLSGNNNKDVLLYNDSRFDENKNKLILEATKNFLFEKCLPILYTNNLYIFFFSLTVLLFKFPPTTQNVVVGALLYIFLFLFYFGFIRNLFQDFLS